MKTYYASDFTLYPRGDDVDNPYRDRSPEPIGDALYLTRIRAQRTVTLSTNALHNSHVCTELRLNTVHALLASANVASLRAQRQLFNLARMRIDPSARAAA